MDGHLYSFQYRLISCCIWILVSVAVCAQSGKVCFTGRVFDTETGQPVSFATVRLLDLPDSVLLAGGATDIKGKYQLYVPVSGKSSFLLQVSYIGYTPVYRTVPASGDNGASSLADVFLMTWKVFHWMKSVVVGQAPMAVTEGDTTVFECILLTVLLRGRCWRIW